MTDRESRVPSEWEDVQRALHQTEHDFIEEIRSERTFEVLDSVRLELRSASLLQRLEASRSHIRVQSDHEVLDGLRGTITWSSEKFLSVIAEGTETIFSSNHVTTFADLGSHIHNPSEVSSLLLEHDTLWFSELIESKMVAQWFLHPRRVVRARCLNFGVDWIDVGDARGIYTIPLTQLCAVQLCLANS